MREVLVLAEHRQGKIRDITFEMLSKGKEIAEEIDVGLTAVILGYEIEELAEKLANHAKKVLLVSDLNLRHFNSEAYEKALSQIISEHKPTLILIGHTSYGIDLAPGLATELDIPLATDCINLNFEDEKLVVVRQVYGGKVNVKASLRKSENYIVTVRPSVFQSGEAEPLKGEILKVNYPITEDIESKKFIEFVEGPEGEVDIAAADIIVSIGRGVGESKNIPEIEQLANILGGVLACSRPIIDKNWLPKDRQVGSSGRTVKPKLYLAIGISGAFQHTVGMKNSELIIAINKDSAAPIFRVADYGIVENLFNIIPALKERIQELKYPKS
ncbi:MAG: electron transfer flavoprotein subunit alpha/FixB family protein [Candidatus Hodarchaeota archaeon]